MGVAPVLHHAVQVLGLGRGDHPSNEPVLHLGTGPIVVPLRCFFTHYLRDTTLLV